MEKNEKLMDIDFNTKPTYGEKKRNRKKKYHTNVYQ